jgi:hypothetical protein
VLGDVQKQSISGTVNLNGLEGINVADLVIRGMEMPKYTTQAEFGIDADGNPLCMVYHEDGTEPDIYDVVPLPEGHGRLGDLDAAYKEALTQVSLAFVSNSKNEAAMAVAMAVYNAPTIVPAEGGVEDG